MRRLPGLIALAALAACSLEPNFQRPDPAIPQSWPVGDAYLKNSEAGLPIVSYRDIFHDPKLQAIIERALANNQDLALAAANIAAARAQYHVDRAALLPQIDASAGVRVSDGNSRTTTNTGTGTTVTTGGGAQSSYNLDVGLTSFEIDLFGRLRSLSHAAFAQYLGSEAAARATRLTLIAEVAEAYLTAASDRSLLAIAVDTERSAGKSVELTHARLKGGVAPRTELRQAETVLDQARADHALQITAVSQDRNALELLVGARVADAELPASIESVDGLLGELPAGLDSTVLLRRPDVVQAEYALRAANARIGSARAAFFPRIALTAIAGLASTALRSLFTGGAFTWQIGPSVTLPIFDGGANKGNLDLAKAQRDAALAQYQKAIQTAFREVADALARQGTIARQFDAQADLAAGAQDNANLQRARYQGGIDTYLASLDAERTLYAARRARAAVRLTRAANLVALYRTLGGEG